MVKFISCGLIRSKSKNRIIVIMKKKKGLILISLALMASLLSVDAFRKAFVFDARIAYAANEPTYGWMYDINGDEIQVQFQSTIACRNLTIKEFNSIYGFSLSSGTSVIEQWCRQHDNSICELSCVGAFLVNNGSLQLLPVVPEYMCF